MHLKKLHLRRAWAAWAASCWSLAMCCVYKGSLIISLISSSKTSSVMLSWMLPMTCTSCREFFTQPTRDIWKRRPSKGQSWRRKTTYQHYYFHQTEFSSNRIASHQYAGIPIYLCLAAATKNNKVQVWRNLAEDMKCIGIFLIVADAHEVPGTSFRTVTTFYHLSSHTRNILLLCSHERNKQPSLICLTPPTPTPSPNPKCITVKYLPGKTTLAFSSCFNLPFSISIR